MNPWPFVIASYALVLSGSLGLTVWAWVAMRRAEAAADAAKGKR